MGRVLSLSAVLLLLWVGLALAATEVICIVDTDPAAEADYHSLADAIAGETGASPKCVTSANLVANDEQLTIECRASSGAADTAAVDIAGFTVSSTCFVKVYVSPAYRHSGARDTSKYRLAVSGNHCITLTNKYCVIDGLQIEPSVGSGVVGYAGIHSGIYGNIFTIKNCLFYGPNTSSGNGVCGIMWENSIFDDYTLIINNIIYNMGSGTYAYGIRARGWADENVLIYNNIISGCNVGCLARAATLCNNVIFNCGTDIDSSDSPSVTYTATDDNSFAGTGNVDISPGATEADDWAAAFNDYANGDFSLKSGSPLIDAGTDLSAVMDSLDIVGTVRPQGDAWDIGAFEYVSSPKWNTITPAKWNGIDWSNLKWNGM